MAELKVVTIDETKRCNKCGEVKNVLKYFRLVIHKGSTNPRPYRWCRRCTNLRKRARENRTWQSIEHKRAIQRASYRKHKEHKRANSRLRDDRLTQATPPWARSGHIYEQMKAFHKNKPHGGHIHVDHIHPLNGKTFCGLNVPWNLQYLTADENFKKGNKLLPEYCELPLTAQVNSAILI